MSEPTVQHVIDIDARFWIERQGRRFVLYAGLLDAAHRQGLKAIRTRLVQVPSDENGNMAICYAEVETERGVFSGIGDAQPENVNRPMVHCLVRMAETRAKARALRDAINVGVAAVEELDDEAMQHEAVPGPPPNGTARPSEARQPQAPRPTQARPGNGPTRPATNGAATEKQIAAIYAIAQREHNLSREETDARCEALYGLKPHELSRQSASDFISTLQGQQ